jgi:hypothetical protein
MSYSSNGNRPKLSEKGLLTPDNCVVALIDHQGQMLFGTSNFDRQDQDEDRVKGGIRNSTITSKRGSASDECQKVRIDHIGMGGHHPVGEARVNLQRAMLQQLSLQQ